jgi:hypothetical protein
VNAKASDPQNSAQRRVFCQSLFTQKIEASPINLEKSIPRSDRSERVVKLAHAALTKVDENPPEFPRMGISLGSVRCYSI